MRVEGVEKEKKTVADAGGAEEMRRSNDVGGYALLYVDLQRCAHHVVVRRRMKDGAGETAGQCGDCVQVGGWQEIVLSITGASFTGMIPIIGTWLA